MSVIRHVLIARELGDNTGQSVRLVALARALRERGLTPVFAVRDLSHAESWLSGKDGFNYVAAPVWLPRLAQRNEPASFASLLEGAGWLDSEGLSALIAGWRGLINLFKPALLIADFSPTALLAARSMRVPACAFGSSYELPAGEARFSPFRWWDDAAIAADESALLASTNAALARFDTAALDHLPQIMGDVPRFAVGLPELAHYGPSSQPTPFFGPSFRQQAGPLADWPVRPARSGSRVFATLRSAHHDFPALIQALQKNACTVLLVSPDLPADKAQALAASGIHVVPGLDLHSAVSGADLVISHANHGVMSAALLAGKPQLVLPTRMEQYMSAVRLERAGLGLYAHPAEHPLDYNRAIQQLTSDSTIRDNAERVAGHHADSSPTQTSAAIAAQCMALI